MLDMVAMVTLTDDSVTIIGTSVVLIWVESNGLSDTSISISSPSPITCSLGILYLITSWLINYQYLVLANAALMAIQRQSNTPPLHSNTLKSVIT